MGDSSSDTESTGVESLDGFEIAKPKAHFETPEQEYQIPKQENEIQNPENEVFKDKKAKEPVQEVTNSEQETQITQRRSTKAEQRTFNPEEPTPTLEATAVGSENGNSSSSSAGLSPTCSTINEDLTKVVTSSDRQTPGDLNVGKRKSQRRVKFATEDRVQWYSTSPCVEGTSDFIAETTVKTKQGVLTKTEREGRMYDMMAVLGIEPGEIVDAITYKFQKRLDTGMGRYLSFSDDFSDEDDESLLPDLFKEEIEWLRENRASLEEHYKLFPELKYSDGVKPKPLNVKRKDTKNKKLPTPGHSNSQKISPTGENERKAVGGSPGRCEKGSEPVGASQLKGVRPDQTERGREERMPTFNVNKEEGKSCPSSNKDLPLREARSSPMAWEVFTGRKFVPLPSSSKEPNVASSDSIIKRKAYDGRLMTRNVTMRGSSGKSGTDQVKHPEREHQSSPDIPRQSEYISTKAKITRQAVRDRFRAREIPSSHETHETDNAQETVQRNIDSINSKALEYFSNEGTMTRKPLQDILPAREAPLLTVQSVVKPTHRCSLKGCNRVEPEIRQGQSCSRRRLTQCWFVRAFSAVRQRLRPLGRFLCCCLPSKDTAVNQ